MGLEVQASAAVRSLICTMATSSTSSGTGARGHSAKETMMLSGLHKFYEVDANFACLRRILGKEGRV